MFRDVWRIRGFLSTIRNLFPEWSLSRSADRLEPLYCSFLLFFLLVFLFLSLARSLARPPLPPRSLRTRLDEDRPAFINHPLKRNPWRSIINDLATNSEEVPRPNETWPVQRSLHLETARRIDAKPKTRFSYYTPVRFVRTDRVLCAHGCAAGLRACPLCVSILGFRRRRRDVSLGRSSPSSKPRSRNTRFPRKRAAIPRGTRVSLTLYLANRV